MAKTRAHPQLKNGSRHHGGVRNRKMPRLRNQKYVLQKRPWGRERGVDPEPHDSRLNHVGSAKAMEGFIAGELCQKEQYQVLIGDDDSTVISRVRNAVDINLEKWSDVNHATCTLTKALYEGKGKDFGPNNDKINDQVIDHIHMHFTRTKITLLALWRESMLLFHTASGTTATADTSINIARTQKAIGSQRSQVEGTFAVMD